MTDQSTDDAIEAVATWMINHNIPTGHGDTLDDLLGEIVANTKAAVARAQPIQDPRNQDWD